MSRSRRAFLQALSIGGLVASGQSRIRGAALQDDPQGEALRGGRAGAERVVGGLRLCWCPAGRFRMGSPASEPGRRDDEVQVDVMLTRGFWIGKFEVTQAEWRRVVGAFPDRPPTAAWGEGDDVPVYWVNFDEAAAFCDALTATAHRSGSLPPAWAFTLPTEAQWEYACRATTFTPWSTGDRLTTADANFDSEADTRTTRPAGGSRRVGSYEPNAWGIHDMHGNVWEWCRDYYHARLPGGTDPDLSGQRGTQNADGTYSRVRRGGAWIESRSFCRSAARLRYEPNRRSDHIGFRVVVIQR